MPDQASERRQVDDGSDHALQLQEVSTALIWEENLDALYRRILDAAISLLSAGGGKSARDLWAPALALANAGHDTRTSSTRCAIRNWHRIGSRTSGDEGDPPGGCVGIDSHRQRESSATVGALRRRISASSAPRLCFNAFSDMISSCNFHAGMTPAIPVF